MRTILSVLTASLVMLVSYLSASAADIKDTPLLPAGISTNDTWSGFFAGVHGGKAWGDWNGPLSYENAYRYTDAKEFPNLTFDDSDKSISANGWYGGAQLGINRQYGNIVVGLEGELSLGDFANDASFLPYPDNYPASPAWHITTDIDWLALMRARFGYTPKPNLLVYVTGGVAIAQTSSSIEPVYAEREPISFATAENNHVGWTIGGGVEHKFSRNVSLRLDYSYVDLGKQDYDFQGTTNGVPSYDTDHYSPDLTLHTVKAGFNWHF